MLKMSIHYETVSLEIREQFRFSKEALETACRALQQYSFIEEHIIVSTCNRTEIIAVVSEIEGGQENILTFLSRSFQCPLEQLKKYCHFQEGEEVIRHLYRLATGLDSLVLGETQILGQVREAFLLGQECQTTGKILNELMKRVLRFAKTAQRDTAIGEQSISMSYIAVQLAREIYPSIHEKTVLVIGSGEMARLALENLRAENVRQVFLVNRSEEKGRMLAEKMGYPFLPLTKIDDILSKADLILTATSADSPIISKRQVRKIMQDRKKRLSCIDLAVPRDIEASVKEIDHVDVYDVDDLQNVIDEHVQTRKEAALLIEANIKHELLSFQTWIEEQDAVPLIHALQKKSLHIQMKTVESIFRKIPHLTEREQKVIEKHTRSIVNQFMEQPIRYMKEMCVSDEFTQDKSKVQEIFGLQIHDEKNEQMEGHR